MSAEVISLKEYRKQKRKRDADAAASANRARHGRSKAQKNEEKAEQRRQENALDGARLDDEDEKPA